MSLQDIYKKAGVVMKPAAMKDGKLYSQQPHSGAGDFNFSRADGVQTRINKHGLIETVADNVPRLSYDLVDGKVSDCPHLLLEPQRLNYSNYTEALSNWVDENVTTTDNQTISPDGSLNASKIVENSSNTFHLISKLTSSTTTANNLVFTCFLKKGTRTNAYVYFRTYNNANRYGINVNLENGTITDTEQSGAPANVETSVTDYGNDWYRVKVRMYQVSGTATMLIGPNNNTTINGINNNYQGDGSSYIYAWGTQLEVGDYETSYIPSPNTSAQKTRQADVCNDSGNSEMFNDSEGVLFAEIAVLEGDTSVVQLSISNGTDNENIKLLQLNSTTVRAEVKMSAGTSFVKDITIDAENFNKFAIQYKANDYKVFVNGTKQSVTQRSTTPTGLDTLNFDRGDGASDFYGKVKELTVINEALTDEQLQLLTTP